MVIAKLNELQEKNLFNERDLKKIDLLLQAVKDWPTSVDTVENFFIEVKYFLKIDNLTYESIKSAMKKISPDNFSWELEALSSLLELASMTNNTNLDIFLFDSNNGLLGSV